MLSCVTSSQPEVRQAAAYGCGVLGLCGGPGLAAAAAQCLPPLCEVVNQTDSRQPENINPTENAISAVTKILKYNNSQVNMDQILPVWFSWLPVTEDVDEAPYVYSFLADLIESNNHHVLGSNNSNLPKLIAIIAEALATEVLPPEDLAKQRLVNLVKQVQGNGAVFEACVASLTEPQKRAIQGLLSS